MSSNHILNSIITFLKILGVIAFIVNGVLGIIALINDNYNQAILCFVVVIMLSIALKEKE